MIKQLYFYRFEIFFFSLLTVLFGSLFFPEQFFNKFIFPFLLLINVGAGILLIFKSKKLVWFFSVLFLGLLFTLGLSMISQSASDDTYLKLRLGFYFSFYIVITLEIIKQVWKTSKVNKNVIIGLMSGYITLGLLGFFLFVTIELFNPNSFGGTLLNISNIDAKFESLLYYSYITLLTIGYGEIIPLTPVSQKAAVLIGLIGQFYIVIITAVVVEKYIRYSSEKKNI